MRFGKNLSYAEAALKVRQIGEYCIRKRLAALENKQEVPNDILTLILQTARELSEMLNVNIVIIHYGPSTIVQTYNYIIKEIRLPTHCTLFRDREGHRHG